MSDQLSTGPGAHPDEKDGLGRRTLGNFTLMFLSSGIQAILRILILAILARLLSQDDFGLANAGLTIVSFAGILSQLGLDKALIQRSELTEAHLRTASTVFVISGVTVGALIALLAPQIAGFFRRDELIPVVRVVALSFPLQGVVMVPAALLQRKLRFRRFAGIDVVSYFGGYGIVGIGLALAGFGVWALIYATLTQALIMACWVIAIQPFPHRPQFDRQAFRDLIYYGGGHTVARGLNQVGGQADNLIVGRWLGIEALGVYGRAYQMLVFPVNLFSSVLSKVLFPSLAKLQHDVPRLARAYQRATAVTALTYLPLSVALIILAPEFVLLLLGPNWHEVVFPFQILAAGLLFRANKVNLVVAQATGAVYNRAWREGIYGGLVVVGSLIGLPWGLAGVAVGVFLALTGNFVLMSQLTLEVTALSWRAYAATHMPALRLSAVTLVVMWFLASVLRNLALPAIFTLIATIAVTAAVLLLLVYLLPRLFLGEEGAWMRDTLLDYLPKRFSTRLVWLKVGRRDHVM
ncbi:MAG: lipopolysaccharide biosynthesis protein [Caldilineaceae bacterium]|nr:lipopolysaccharide biosynthesis protein [Caldilineaceae bacterium]